MHTVNLSSIARKKKRKKSHSGKWSGIARNVYKGVFDSLIFLAKKRSKGNDI